MRLRTQRILILQQVKKYILISNIYIRYSKTGEPRDIPCNCAKFLARWRQHVNEYRRAVGLRKVTKKDYVFFNPHTDNPYPYSQFSVAWSDLRANLSLVLSPVRSDKKYTLYSLRSSYITNQINEGKDPVSYTHLTLPTILLV